MSAGPCPACGGRGDPVERRRDPVGGTEYALSRCAACGLVFSDPRDPVGPEWYEKSAPLRAAEARGEPGRDPRFLWFLERAGTPGKVLDVGCGDGGFLSLAAARGWTGTGVDYEERMVALARARGLDAHARDYASFLSGRVPGEFDAATLFDVLEHVPEPRALLGPVKRVLKGGGLLAVTLPNGARPTPFGREAFDYPPHHFTRWTPAALRAFLEREGFEVLDVRTKGPSVRWMSETLFFAWIAPPALALARRLLFGAGAKGTITDLYAGGAPAGGAASALSDKPRRQALIDALKYACRLLTYPAGAVLAAAYRLRPGSGEYLYALARYAP